MNTDIEENMTCFYNNKTAPSYIINNSDVEYKSMPIDELKDMGINSTRLNKIISELPFGAWIAGGFLRSVISSEDDTDGDIDLFFNSEDSFQKMMEIIKNPKTINAKKAFGFYNINDYADITKLRLVDCESLIEFRPKIQLIRLYWFKTAINVIDSFDFSVCQLITDGKTLWYGPHTLDDIKTKTIRRHLDTGDAVCSLNRILKYQAKGYKISKDEFKTIEASAISLLDDPNWVSKYFYFDSIENKLHDRTISPMSRVMNYLETSIESAAIYKKAMKKSTSKKSIHGTSIRHTPLFYEAIKYNDNYNAIVTPDHLNDISTNIECTVNIPEKHISHVLNKTARATYVWQGS